MPTADVTYPTIVTISADCKASYSFVGSDFYAFLSSLPPPPSTSLFVFACEMDGRLLSKERGTICDCVDWLRTVLEFQD
jgi:hypothetical protein